MPLGTPRAICWGHGPEEVACAGSRGLSGLLDACNPRSRWGARRVCPPGEDAGRLMGSMAFTAVKT
eukprot:3678794-Heterocapsa_arctica.AAC.1